jgi:hypothetical protein
MQSDQVQFLQGLRGVQPVIFLAYLVVRRAMTIKDLQLCTGLSDDALRPALESLAGKGWIFKQVGQHGRVLWVPSGDTFFGRIFQSPLTADSGALSSSSSNINLKSLPLQQEQQEEDQNPLRADSAAVLAALDAAGIREPKRSQLASLEHVTVELISGHVAVLGEGGQLGTAIYRIQNNWPVITVRPVATEERFSMICEGCHCSPCVCSEHDAECECINCKREHPERFCTATVVLHRGRPSESWKECGALVVPGQTRCAIHLRDESEDE